MQHNMTKKQWLFCAGILIAPLVHAQQSRTIRLQEAIDSSLAYSHVLKNHRAKIGEAKAMVAEAKERQLPEVGVSASYLYLPVTPTVQLKSDSSGGGGPKVNQVLYGTLSASLPIYAGGKLRYGIESSGYLLKAAEMEAEGNRDGIVFNSIQAYSNLYKALQTVSLVKKNLLQAQQRVKDFTDLEKNGLLARNELLKAELQSSNIELTLLDAESNYQLASVNLSLMMGLPEQTQLIPDSASLFAGSLPLKKLEDYEQLAIDGRKDVSAIGFRKKAAEVGVKAVHADALPSFAVTAGYIAADIPGFLTVYNAVNIGVGVKYNISSIWKSKSSLAAAKSRVEQLTTNENQLKDQIRLQINQAYQSYQLSLKKIEVYQKAVEQAQENYRITQNKYNNALATTTELLDADVAELQTNINLTNARADAQVAYQQLLRVAGLITSH